QWPYNSRDTPLFLEQVLRKEHLREYPATLLGENFVQAILTASTTFGPRHLFSLGFAPTQVENGWTLEEDSPLVRSVAEYFFSKTSSPRKVDELLGALPVRRDDDTTNRPHDGNNRASPSKARRSACEQWRVRAFPVKELLVDTRRYVAFDDVINHDASPLLLPLLRRKLDKIAHQAQEERVRAVATWLCSRGNPPAKDEDRDEKEREAARNPPVCKLILSFETSLAPEPERLLDLKFWIDLESPERFSHVMSIRLPNVSKAELDVLKAELDHEAVQATGSGAASTTSWPSDSVSADHVLELQCADDVHVI
ncbi:unnamed protein product, partial [Amoebophrya sp. A120]